MTDDPQQPDQQPERQPEPQPERKPDVRRPWAVFDIDGVLADVRHRLHHLGARPPDWRGFFATADADPPLAEGLALLTRLATDHRVAYVTGRPERLRRVTATWLADQGLPSGPLLMRPGGDHRPARHLKLELLAQLAAEAHIALVVDDDEEVVEAVRSAGIRVQHARWVTRSRRLQRAQDFEGRT
ncbi:MAG: phosphatase domain-containing protein [Actinomycetes bacterium]